MQDVMANVRPSKASPDNTYIAELNEEVSTTVVIDEEDARRLGTANRLAVPLGRVYDRGVADGGVLHGLELEAQRRTGAALGGGARPDFHIPLGQIK